MRQDTAGLRRQRSQQRVFGRCQAHIFTATTDTSPRQVDPQIADSDLRERHLPPLGMPQRDTNPRQQFVGTERLSQIVVRAKIKRADLLRLLIACGQHKNRHITPTAQLPADLHPIRIRQAQIENDYGRRVARGYIEAFLASGGNTHTIATFAQTGSQQPPDR